MEDLITKHDRLISEFHHSKDRENYIGATAAVHHQGDRQRTVVLALTHQYMSVHYDGYRWESRSRSKPRQAVRHHRPS